MNRRRMIAALAATGLLGTGWWLAAGSATPEPAPTTVAMAAPAVAPPGSAPAPAAGLGPRRVRDPAELAAQRALWQQRLQRAREVRDAYAAATRYPPESRPAAEHGDQLHPGRPVQETMPLRMPGAPARDGFQLRSSQDRIYLQGDEAVRLSVAAVDDAGQPLPLAVTRAIAHEAAQGQQRASRYGQVDVSFRDDGQNGDTQAGDGELTLRWQPATQGFAELDGLIRIELSLQSGEQAGYAYFDVIYTPAAPATWLPGAREAVQDGSLNLLLKLQVQQAGRYVISGRVDDANGKPFALVGFNDTLAAGTRELALPVFGKLLRDGQPAFPLTLRDVTGFLLHEDRFPDRALLAAREGKVYTTRAHVLAEFSSAEWQSEERRRYLTEYDKDVAQAEAQLRQLSEPATVAGP